MLTDTLLMNTLKINDVKENHKIILYHNVGYFPGILWLNNQLLNGYFIIMCLNNRSLVSTVSLNKILSK